MVDEVMRLMQGMTLGQLREVVDITKVLIIRELRGPDEEPERCPHCGCEFIAGKGLQRADDGSTTQRWMCR